MEEEYESPVTDNSLQDATTEPENEKDKPVVAIV